MCARARWGRQQGCQESRPPRYRCWRYTSSPSAAGARWPSDLVTFHVKRSSTDAGADLNQIAKSGRRLGEVFLLSVPGSVGLEFAERIEKLAHALAQWGSKMNLTAHPDDPEEIAFHMIDSLMPVTLAIDKSS